MSNLFETLFWKVKNVDATFEILESFFKLGVNGFVYIY